MFLQHQPSRKTGTPSAILRRVRGIQHRAWLLSLLSACLQVAIFPLPGFYLLCWIALAPLFVALLHARRPETLQLELAGDKLLPATPWQGFLLAYVCGIVWYGGTCYWIFDTMHKYGGLNVAVSALLLLAYCMVMGLHHGLFGLLVGLLASSRGPLRRFALALAPVLWVTVELARTRIIGVPWNLLGTVQVDNIPLARIAMVTSVYGISFEIALVNAALAASWLMPRGRRAKMLAVCAAVAALLQAGRWLPSGPNAADHRAVLVQENLPVAEAPWTDDYYRQMLKEFSDLSFAGATSGIKPDLILWPESPSPFNTRDPFFREALSNVARQSQAWVVAGSLGYDEPKSHGMQMAGQGSQGQAAVRSDAIYNSAGLVNPAGDWTGRYDKVHLVPFGEYVPFRRFLPFMDMLAKEVGDFDHGSSRQPLQAGATRLGVFICYESVFPDEVRQFAANGAQVFVNISNDGWYGDSGAWAQHLLQARMRAMENHRWLLRDTNTGLTAAIDPDGRVAAQIPRKQRTRLEAPYSLLEDTTFYTRHGDWFAYLCAIISVGAVVASFFSVTNSTTDSAAQKQS